MSDLIPTELSRGVMRRVYLIWLARFLVRPFAIRIWLLLGFSWFFSRLVSLGNIWDNAWSSGGRYQFFVSAYTGTEVSVQSLTLVLAILALWFACDCALFGWRAIFTRRVSF